MLPLIGTSSRGEPVVSCRLAARIRLHLLRLYLLQQERVDPVEAARGAQTRSAVRRDVLQLLRSLQGLGEEGLIRTSPGLRGGMRDGGASRL